MRTFTLAVVAAAAVLVPVTTVATADAQAPSVSSATRRAESAMRKHFKRAPFRLKMHDYVKAYRCHRDGSRVVACTVDLAGYRGYDEDRSPYYVCVGEARVSRSAVRFRRDRCLRQ